MRTLCTIGAIAVAAAATCANAGLTFSFADPVPGRQMHYNSVSALISYDTPVSLNFLVDGSTEPTPFNALFADSHLQLALNVGAPVAFGPAIQAPVAGFFEVRDSVGTLIVRGDTDAGSFIRIGSTSSILMSSDISFGFTAGPALLALLEPGRTLSDPQESVFTVTDLAVVGGGPLLVGGNMQSWDANASYSGNSEVVPAPGAFALCALGGLTLAARRRKA